MSKILITGATGFIGSTLSELLVSKGYNVKAFDRYNINNHWGFLENSKYKNNIEVILGDIRDYDSVSNVMKGCECVIHLAALISIPYSYISPLAYIRTNIEGTYNVLEAAKNNNIKQIIITSTSEVYGKSQYTPMNENHPMIAQSPYASSKIAADQLSLSYFSSFKLPIKIVRPFNTYGPRQSSRAIIPTIINQCLSNNKKIKIGNIKPTRDFTYVDDTCNAFLEILKNESFFGEIVNVGSNNEISVKEILNKILKILKVNKQIIIESNRKRPKTSEVYQLVCDNNKLLSTTKWRPKIKIEQGLTKTIKWFKKINDTSKSNIYNI